MNDLLVIGGASMDQLHLAGGTAKTIGGAGLYTALAAHRCGARVALLAPRPEPCPASLQPLADRLTTWHGPAVSSADLPRFEIAYPDGHTEYRLSNFDAVLQLTPELLPSDLSGASLIHVTPLGDPVRQLAFLEACRQRGAPSSRPEPAVNHIVLSAIWNRFVSRNESCFNRSFARRSISREVLQAFP